MMEALYMETFLLDKQYKHILEIVSQVSKKPTKEISFNDLETELNLTQKTIKTYLYTLLTYCERNDLKTFTLEKGKLKMLLKTDFNYFDLYHYLIQKSVKYQIIMSILTNPKITFTELYLDLKLSRSNASLHIKQLNDFLKPYHCKISFLQNNPLQGEEHQIRFLYYNLLLGCNIDQIITTSPSLDQVTQLVLDVVPHITHTTLSKIKLGFYIFQMSSKFGFFIDSEEDFIIQDSPFIKYDDFFKKIDGFEFLNDCPDLRTKQKKCRYLYFLFCRANVLTPEECEQYLLQIPSNNSPSIQYFLTQFQEKSQLSLKQHEIKYLTYNLALFHREAAIFSGRAKTLDLVKSVEKFNRVDDTVPKLIKKFTKSLYKENDEIRALIQNFPSLWHYYTILLWILSAKHHQPIKLLVQSSISSLHRQALITQIINGTSSPIEIYTYEQLNGEKPDGIVSNQPPEKNLQDVPFFPISLFYMDWHNKGNLAFFIKQLETKKRGDKG